MKILRGILLGVLFIAGVFICSANVHSVELVVWPDLGLGIFPGSLAYEVPLFLLVLASVVIGLVLGGGAALFEQGRLRLSVRRAEKETKRLRAEEVAVAANLEAEKEAAVALSAELDGARARIAELEALVASAAAAGADDADDGGVEGEPSSPSRDGDDDPVDDPADDQTPPR